MYFKAIEKEGNFIPFIISFPNSQSKKYDYCKK